MKKFLCIMLFVAIGTLPFTIPSSARAAEVEVKTGYFWNWNEGEQKLVFATPIKSWDIGIDIDVWATDLDQLIAKKITDDWSGGLGVTYNKKVTILGKEINLSAGPGIGLERPIDDEAEFIYGAMAYGAMRF